jgi:membrane-associated phospholipid phosphatase
MAPFLLLDPGLNVAAQHFSPLLTTILAAGKFLDSAPVYLTVVVLLYLGFHPKYGIRLAVLFGFASGLNEALKLFFHLPRPYWVSPAVKAYSSLPSFGFPSGGAMCSTVVYGYVAATVRRYWIVLACVVLAGLTVSARIFAGVHFVLDVVGGLAFGLLVLLLFLYFSPKIDAFVAGLSPRGRMVGILVLSALPLLCALPAYYSLAGWQLPQEWAATAMSQTGVPINPVQVITAWQSAGLVLGSLLGYEFLRRQGGWIPPVSSLHRGTIAVFGVISTLALYGLAESALARAGPLLPAPVVLVVPALVAGLWFTACVPLLARRGPNVILKTKDGPFLPRQP